MNGPKVDTAEHYLRKYRIVLEYSQYKYEMLCEPRPKSLERNTSEYFAQDLLFAHTGITKYDDFDKPYWTHIIKSDGDLCWNSFSRFVKHSEIYFDF